MHRTESHETQSREPRFALSHCLEEMRAILFEGTPIGEARIESLLDRMERRP